MSPFETIILAAQKAQSEFSVIHGKQEDNAQVLQEFAVEALKELANLVHMAGGDNSFLTPVIEGIENDIDLCFFERRYPESLFAGEPPVFKSGMIAKPSNLQAAE